jgi:PIN domain nuclease of toxin-antitoxin system
VWATGDDRLSRLAERAIERSDELAVSSITWFELAWLVRQDRIRIAVPLRSWLDRLAGLLRTVEITPGVAETAASLPSSFPSDPIDRIIYATAIEKGWRLVTKDERMREHKHARAITIW